MLDQKGHEMAGQLQNRNIGIEVHAVNAFALESNMLVEYSVYVRHRYLLVECSYPREYHAECCFGEVCP